MASPGRDRRSSRAWIAVIAVLVLLALGWMILAPQSRESESPPLLNAGEQDLPDPVGSLDHPVPVHLTDGDPKATDRVPPPPSPLPSPRPSPSPSGQER